MTVWRLKKGAERRFRAGHPWIFASELAQSARELIPGDLVELRDFQNHFLAFGYGHPKSQICFRRLSSRASDGPLLMTTGFLRERLRAARSLRERCGWASASHRWVYAEADGLPGLIVDAFLTPDQGWTVVVQASTAGIEKALPQIYSALEEFAQELQPLTVVVAPSSKSRVLEGLSLAEKSVVRGAAVDLENYKICLHGKLILSCDLLRGQKTGFFLDQQWNAQVMRTLLRSDGELRVLDICCYVGQWAAHAARALNKNAHVTLFDASEKALMLAKSNLEPLAKTVATVQGDVLKDLAQLPEKSFDVVICDPPAFVKKRADHESGLRAYTKLNREAMRLAKPGGLYVASSCSGLVAASEWREVIAQASQKAGRMFKAVALGGHGPDHPVRPEYPEGEYLKCVFGHIEFPY